MTTDPLAVQFSEALDLLDRLVDPLLDIGICKPRVVAWKAMMRDVVNEHLEKPMSNGAKVAAIKQAWREASATAVVDLDLMAQVAINVLTDWHKR